MAEVKDTSSEAGAPIKIEARLNAREEEAFKSYMRRHFLTNRSEALRAILREKLTAEGHLANKPEQLNNRVTDTVRATVALIPTAAAVATECVMALPPTHRFLIAVFGAIMLDATDGTLDLLGGLRLW